MCTTAVLLVSASKPHVSVTLPRCPVCVDTGASPLGPIFGRKIIDIDMHGI